MFAPNVTNFLCKITTCRKHFHQRLKGTHSQSKKRKYIHRKVTPAKFRYLEFHVSHIPIVDLGLVLRLSIDLTCYRMDSPWRENISVILHTSLHNFRDSTRCSLRFLAPVRTSVGNHGLFGFRRVTRVLKYALTCLIKNAILQHVLTFLFTSLSCEFSLNP